LGSEFLREPFDSTLGVDELLASREEGMAGRTDFQVQFGLGRAGPERVAAGATRLDIVGLRVDTVLHSELLRICYKRGLYHLARQCGQAARREALVGGPG
jgi:hypothetical protein